MEVLFFFGVLFFFEYRRMCKGVMDPSTYSLLFSAHSLHLSECVCHTSLGHATGERHGILTLTNR